ncbi:MAG: TPM domain-containing protein, partial [Microbacterium sp.]
MAFSLGAVALAALIAGPAAAAEPVELGSGHVHDDPEIDALTSAEEAEVDDALAQLSSETDIDLWVVFVGDFENPSDSDEWGIATAEQNNLGDSDYLLSVAVDGRSYTITMPNDGPLSDADRQEIGQQVEPHLADDDWAGAAIAAADAFRDTRSGGSGGGIMTVVWIVIIVAAVGVIAWVALRARRRRAAEGAPARQG